MLLHSGLISHELYSCHPLLYWEGLVPTLRLRSATYHEDPFKFISNLEM